MPCHAMSRHLMSGHPLPSHAILFHPVSCNPSHAIHPSPDGMLLVQAGHDGRSRRRQRESEDSRRDRRENSSPGDQVRRAY